jgi:hypothetical protein
MEVTMPPASNHPGSDNSIPSSEPPPTIHTHHPPSCSRVSSTQDQSYQFPSVPALSDKLNCMQEHGIGWALLSLLPYNDRPWIGRRGLFNVDHGDFLWWYAVLSMDKTWKGDEVDHSLFGSGVVRSLERYLPGVGTPAESQALTGLQWTMSAYEMVDLESDFDLLIFSTWHSMAFLRAGGYQ